jgi:TRAP-type C4-dicarboxylate transport system substrate-binding protein
VKRASILFLVTLLVLTSLSLVVACPKGPDEPVVLRVATPYPALDPVNLEVQKLADGFNARTDGKYIMEVHPGESLVKMMENVDAVRTGAVEMAGFPLGTFGSLDPRLSTAEVPFLYSTINAEAAALDSLVPMYNQFMEEKFNQKMLGACTAMGCEMIGNKEVKTMEDWDGLLVQSLSPTHSGFIEALGGAAVSAVFTEAYSVLEKGVVDVTMCSPMFMESFGLYEVADYVTLGYFVPASLCVTINMDTWNSLPKDVQDILLDESAKFQRSANDSFVTMYEANREALAGYVDVYILPAAERDKWRAVVWPAVSEPILAAMGDFGQEVSRIAEDVNAQYPY